MQLLVSNGSNIDAEDSVSRAACAVTAVRFVICVCRKVKMAPLRHAADNGHAAAVQLLLSAGADKTCIRY